MEQTKETLEIIEHLAEKNGKYKKEAYLFVFGALDYTLRKLKVHRHVTGQELLQGISEYGRSEYGPMTKTVFQYWGVTKTEDFGRIVFDLVDAGLMGKTETDSIDDFKNGYDFEEEFVKKYKKDKGEQKT
ncbi:MAG: Minf_1886 family protein [bacterium]